MRELQNLNICTPAFIKKSLKISKGQSEPVNQRNRHLTISPLFLTPIFNYQSLFLKTYIFHTTLFHQFINLEVLI